jgi:hypothetical protein
MSSSSRNAGGSPKRPIDESLQALKVDTDIANNAESLNQAAATPMQPTPRTALRKLVNNKLIDCLGPEVSSNHIFFVTHQNSSMVVSDAVKANAQKLAFTSHFFTGTADFKLEKEDARKFILNKFIETLSLDEVSEINLYTELNLGFPGENVNSISQLQKQIDLLPAIKQKKLVVVHDNADYKKVLGKNKLHEPNTPLLIPVKCYLRGGGGTLPKELDPEVSNVDNMAADVTNLSYGKQSGMVFTGYFARLTPTPKSFELGSSSGFTRVTSEPTLSTAMINSGLNTPISRHALSETAMANLSGNTTPFLPTYLESNNDAQTAAMLLTSPKMVAPPSLVENDELNASIDSDDEPKPIKKFQFPANEQAQKLETEVKQSESPRLFSSAVSSDAQGVQAVKEVTVPKLKT